MKSHSLLPLLFIGMARLTHSLLRLRQFQFTMRTRVTTAILRSSSTATDAAPAPKQGAEKNAELFSVAPMMEYTDRHQRTLFRLLSRHAKLYTEMVTTNALVRNEEDPVRFLDADFGVEGPLVLQLGGSDPGQMRDAARIAYKYGYREMNINCGCPSEKVAGAGCFGAALMQSPSLVSDLSNAVGDATGTPATIKCRIGVNDDDSYEQLAAFVDHVSRHGGVQHFSVHARKAVLGANFSPDDNRKIPPLKHDFVFRLAEEDFPHLKFSLNGGIESLQDCRRVLDAHPALAGVMVGRACVNSVFQWASVDSVLFRDQAGDPGLSRREVLVRYATYADGIERSQGIRARRSLVKPLLGLFTGEPRGRLFRAKLDEYLLAISSQGPQQRQGLTSVGDVILKAAECLQPETLDLHPKNWGRDKGGGAVSVADSDSRATSSSTPARGESLMNELRRQQWGSTQDSGGEREAAPSVSAAAKF